MSTMVPPGLVEFDRIRVGGARPPTIPRSNNQKDEAAPR